MNVLTMALAGGALLFLGYLFYGRFISRKIFGAGDFADENMPSRKFEDGVDFVPTRRHVLLGHHYVTIAGAGPIVGPAVAVTWGWLPALLWVVLGVIFIGAVHDLGALVASVRNRARTIGDLAADIMTPRVRLLFLTFIALLIMVVLAVFAFVIAALLTAKPASALAIWIEVPLAMVVAHLVFKKGQSMLLWSIVALVVMYGAIWVGTLDPVMEFFTFSKGSSGILFWMIVLFAYTMVASSMSVKKLLQPRDMINGHQLFVALVVVVVGIVIASFTSGGRESLEIVAPAVNDQLPASAPPLFPFLFIFIACGAVSGFHAVAASGTTSRQIDSEKNATSIGYGSMILEGALAIIVILCCVSAAGFGDAGAWHGQYSSSWVGKGTLFHKIQGFMDGGATYMQMALPFLSHQFLVVVISVVVISFAATTMDSATRIQRYCLSELATAVHLKPLANKHVATFLAVASYAAMALLAGKGGAGGLILWPVFGILNQLLACLVLLVVSVWLAKRGKPILYTLVPMLFLLTTVTWAGFSRLITFSQEPGKNWYLIATILAGLLLEVWMLVEGVVIFSMARQVKRRLASGELSPGEARVAMAGPTGMVIDAEGVILEPGNEETSENNIES